jgi:hypothetical protein
LVDQARPVRQPLASHVEVVATREALLLGVLPPRGVRAEHPGTRPDHLAAAGAAAIPAVRPAEEPALHPPGSIAGAMRHSRVTAHLNQIRPEPQRPDDDEAPEFPLSPAEQQGER